MKNKDYVQGALFEKDFLVRTLGNLANQPDIALTELIANAWDAGATEVEIFIPEKHGELLTIKDNGTGLTQDEFKSRWMKLGYNRLENQGKKVVFPNGVEFKRYAYGRNGVGRHGLLCFNDEYTVITSKDAVQSTFQITTQSEKEPFVIKEESRKKANSQGTILEVVVTKNLPKSSEINDIISARFLHDPNFKITINRNTINLATHAGLIKTIDFPYENYNFKIHLIDTKKSRKNTLYQGVAIWQSGRLIGEPSWALGANIILDGRTQEAKKYSIVIETNDLEQYIREDWSGFKYHKNLNLIFSKLADRVTEIFSEIAIENIEDTKKSVKKLYQNQYNSLSPLAKYEFNEALEHIAKTNPTAKQDSINLAMETLINLENTRGGSELLQKLSTFKSEDVEGLNKLLDNWTIKDALTVLDEIDKRISVIESIRKLSSDKTVDELHVLHPLIASARWIFGPEFDSPEYSYNNQLHTTVEKVFGKKIDRGIFNNYKKRPDIVVMGDSTFSINCTDDVDTDSGISSIKKILIIELKRGGFKIGRDERNQAVTYVEDFMSCGTIIGNPYINAFVVGESFSEKIQPIQTIKNDNQVEMGKVQICLFSQIVDSSERRLFNLRSKLSERYSEFTDSDILTKQTKAAI
ncbi:ATP-binding protein [Elizabethkingia meningoseptica]|uniref:ATP-binding protein n=1 Tax=Elizabethkingia meningoseptica TaxID=238 RepID=UPI00136675FE|nr:ATP-binding protein [Elizabethkingia meningoseptica]MDE5488082.1 ATP-binding protein [Elizabethkingia meningoseptica]MVW91094.1 ATP-binding protein [Elizabethkingia meningoseptica]